MQTKYLPVLAAAAATTVSASEITRVNVVHIVETLQLGKHIPSFTPNKRDMDAIFARDSDGDCTSSARSILSSFPTPKPEIESWLLSAETTKPCTMEAPSSLSSDLMKYITEINEWAVEKDGDLHAISDSCLDEDDVDDAGQFGCSTPGVLLFTTDKTTETVQLKTALATFTPTGSAATSTKAPNAAATGGANAFAAAAAVGVAAFMIGA
ncbi:infection structure specific [Fusarium heterosporum]|uniref:Infection structure specific n=1 Tax=Fusarium heterosporum TaxID=42747 RepID=A0A8H5T425_FUSHE|nr:infection structure specific [Fusarium heterosporum]